jgi:integrase
LARKKYNLNEHGLPDGEGLYYMKGSPYIWAKVYIDGAPKPFSTKQTDYRKAMKVRDEERKRLEKQDSTTSDLQKVTLEDLMDNYIRHLTVLGESRGDYKPDTAYITERVTKKHLYRLFGENLRAVKLGTTLIGKYRSTRLKEERTTPYTVDKELALVRAAMNLGAKSTPKMFDKSLIPDFKIDKANATAGVRSGEITLEQYDMLLPHMPEWMKPMFAVCMTTGVRKKEAQFIKMDQLHLHTRKITLKALETKSKKERIIGIPPEMNVWGVVEGWAKQTRVQHPACKYLFNVGGEQITPSQLDSAFSRVCLAAGLAHYRKDDDGEFVLDRRRCKIIDKDVHWHDSRRAFVTMAGKPVGVNDTDRGRVAGQTAATTANYDQNDSASRVAIGVGGIMAEHSNGGALKGIASAVDAEDVLFTPPVPVAPPPSVSDWKTELKELKDLKDAGLLPDDLYRAEVSKVMANR